MCSRNKIYCERFGVKRQTYQVTPLIRTVPSIFFLAVRLSTAAAPAPSRCLKTSLLLFLWNDKLYCSPCVVYL